MSMEISVIIPLYNKRDGVERAIASILRQTSPASEIVVVNDGSTDGSDAVVAALGVPNLRLIDQNNAGVSAARNRGAEEARHEWIAFLDSDDEWMPGFLENIRVLNGKYPEKEFLCSAYYRGDYKGDKKPIELNGICFPGEHGVMENYFHVASVSSPPIHSSAVCMKRNLLLGIGGFPLNVRSGEDLITWARLTAISPPAYCTLPLGVFWQDRAHTYDDKPNRVPERDDPIGKALVELQKDTRMSTPFIGQYLSHWHKMRASVYLRLGRRLLCLKECAKGLYYEPSNYRLLVYMALCATPDAIVRKAFKTFGK